MARVRGYRLAQGQARQTKSKKENKDVIKVIRLNKEGGDVPLVYENQRPKDAPSLFIGCKITTTIFNLSYHVSCNIYVVCCM
jgi:hypothetical protein